MGWGRDGANWEVEAVAAVFRLRFPCRNVGSDLLKLLFIFQEKPHAAFTWFLLIFKGWQLTRNWRDTFVGCVWPMSCPFSSSGAEESLEHREARYSKNIEYWLYSNISTDISIRGCWYYISWGFSNAKNVPFYKGKHLLDMLYRLTVLMLLKSLPTQD